MYNKDAFEAKIKGGNTNEEVTCYRSFPGYASVPGCLPEGTC
jgi:hypothetical protein